MPKTVDDLHDAKGLCVDKRPIGGVAAGCPTFVNYSSVVELEDVMVLIDQC